MQVEMPLNMETYYVISAEETGTLKCQSEWKAVFKSIVTRNA